MPVVKLPNEDGRLEAYRLAEPRSWKRSGGQEFRRIAPDRAWLEELAKSTGGEVVQPDQLDDFVSTLSRRPAPITEMTTSPLWQHPLVLLLIAAGLCGDWAWRRWRGLP